jgi:hypothetical protein
MDEIESLVIRRIAIKMEQRQGGAAGHAVSLGEPGSRVNGRAASNCPNRRREKARCAACHGPATAAPLADESTPWG